MARATLSTKGQVVLPQAIRNQLGLTPGSELEVTTDGDTVILRRVSRFRTVDLKDAIGCVAYDGPVRSIEEMNAGIDEMLRSRVGSR
jgi:AbrB family looped-hinge helix DNA binding protein